MRSPAVPHSVPAEVTAVHPYLSGEPPIALAHRGAHGDGAGENSFEAFDRAVALGYRYLETDVHLTADGVVVAMHDETLERTTDGQGAVAQRPWSELARLRVTGGGRVPTLEQLLEAWPAARWNIDCKAADAVGSLVAVVRGHDAIDRVCVGSFEPRIVEAARSRAPDSLCTAATRQEVRRLLAASRLPRTARRPLVAGLRCDAVQVPVAEGSTRIVTERFVETCHDVGIAVHVWTVDDERQMRALLDIGVDGLMTDRPTTLRDVLEDRGAWPPRDRGPVAPVSDGRDGA